MKPTTSDPIKAISRAISIEDAYSFVVFDRRMYVAYQHPYQKWDKPLEHFGENSGEEPQLIANLTSQLSSVIYGAFYVKGEVKPKAMQDWEQLHFHPGQEQDMAFIEELSKHNQSREQLDKFWRVYALDQQGNAYVEKNGEVRPLQAGTYEFANVGETSLAVNSIVHIKQTREYRELQPTFYHVNSAALMPAGEEIGRFYWNIDPEGAKYLVEEISGVFNRYGVPFMFKCTNHPDRYTRTDGAVLYILRKQFRLASRLLRLALPRLKPYLKQGVPLFTRHLVDGLSYAEDPGMNQSFGMSRSKIIAEGIVRAYRLRHNHPTAQYREILKAFKQNGLDVRKPYLRPNSHWSYDFDFFSQL